MRPGAARRSAAFGLILSFALGGGVWQSARLDAQTKATSITVTPAASVPGAWLVVGLDGWPVGDVAVAVCGNAARRGSEDCDLINSVMVPVRSARPTATRFLVTTPPVGCPCVIRANTTANDMVRAAPITLAGVPDGVDILPATPGPVPRQLAVSVALTKRSATFDAILSPLAGPVHGSLVVTFRNRGTTDLRGLRIEGGIGRTRADSEPLRAMPAVDVPAGRTRRVTIPIELGVPAWGHYVVFGSVFGAAVPTTFHVTTGNDPWALELLVPVLLLVWAEYLRWRDRVRRRRIEVRLEEEAVVPEGFPDRSPDVGDAYGRCYEDGSYARPHHEPGEPYEPEPDGSRLVGAEPARPQ